MCQLLLLMDVLRQTSLVDRATDLACDGLLRFVDQLGFGTSLSNGERGVSLRELVMNGAHPMRPDAAVSRIENAAQHRCFRNLVTREAPVDRCRAFEACSNVRRCRLELTETLEKHRMISRCGNG